MNINKIDLSVETREKTIQRGDIINVRLRIYTDKPDGLYRLLSSGKFGDIGLHIKFYDKDKGWITFYPKDLVNLMKVFKGSNYVDVYFAIPADKLIDRGFGGRVEVYADVTYTTVKGRRIFFYESRSGKPIPNVVVEFRERTYKSNPQGYVDLEPLPPGTSWIAQWSYWTPGGVKKGAINVASDGIYRVYIDLGGVVPI